MSVIPQTSDTFIGSLCREVDSIRSRYQRITESLKIARDETLVMRLEKEADRLNNRREEIIRSTKILKVFTPNDRLSFEFLQEVARRPLSALIT